MAKATKLSGPGSYEGLSQYRPPLNYELTGKSFTLVMDDGTDLIITFKDRHTIEYGPLGGTLKTLTGDVLKLEDDLFFVNFTEIPETPRKGVTLILDIEQSLVTIVNVYDGWNPKYPHMVRTENIFGAIEREGLPLPSVRHGYTDDLVGKAIYWDYGTLRVTHVYQSSRYYRLIIADDEADFFDFGDGNGPVNPFHREGITYEEPCDYIKVKNGIYIFSMTEQNRSRWGTFGANLLFLMDLNRMHDVGRSFGIGGDGKSSHPENYTYGAFGKYVDASEHMKLKTTAHIE